MKAHPTLVAVNGAWAGLGNRIRFTLSAESIALSERRCFAYVWPTRSGLFEPALTDLWDYSALRLPWGSVIPTMTEHRARLSHKRPLTGLRARRDWAILGTSVLHADGREAAWDKRLVELSPVPEIRERVAGVKNQLPEQYVGVQIRASPVSHPSTLAASPVSWFTERMHDLLRTDPTTHFYLSCDDPAAQVRVKETVPNTISLEGKGAYNSVEGMRSAVTDLYALAGSSMLLGPYLSSFVELAWLLGGRSQLLENSVHRFEPGSAIHKHEPVSASFQPLPTEFYVRNQFLVARDRIRAEATQWTSTIRGGLSDRYNPANSRGG